MSLSVAQLRWLALAPKITGALSLTFNTLVVAHVLRDPGRRKKFYHRLILGLGLVDLSSSLWLAMSTWPVVAGTPPILWAVGNEASCMAQGFFVQFGIGGPIYNASLSFYYLLAIKYAWKDFELGRWEAVFHGVPLAWATVTAAAALFMGMLRPAFFWCWIGQNEVGTPDANVVRMAFLYGPLWLSVAVVLANLVQVFLYVRDLTLRSEKHLRRSLHSSMMGDPSSSAGTGTGTTTSPGSFLAAARHGNRQFVNVEDDYLYSDQGYSSNATYGDDDDEDDERDVRSPSRLASDLAAATAAAEMMVAAEQRRLEAQLSFAERRRAVAFQCLRFALAFFVPWSPITAVRVLQMVGRPVPYGLLLASAAVTPLAGVPKWLAYMFPLFRSKLDARQVQRRSRERGGRSRVGDNRATHSRPPESRVEGSPAEDEEPDSQQPTSWANATVSGVEEPQPLQISLSSFNSNFTGSS